MFDGQSLSNTPDANPFPLQAMSGRVEPWSVTAVNGSTYANRATTAPDRVDRLVKNAQRSVLFQWGGVTELATGTSAVDLLAAAESYADARRTAGWDRIVALTVPHATAYTAGQNTQRAAYNAALLTSDSFDAVVDVAADPAMQDASDTDFFDPDGTHFATGGAAVVAGLVIPVLNSI